VFDLLFSPELFPTSVSYRRSFLSRFSPSWSIELLFYISGMTHALPPP
jgi:hypothetical protein